MRKLKFMTIGLFLVLTCSTAFAQDEGAERVTIPFSNPSRPGKVKVGLINGGIMVRGYSGNEVVIESRPKGSDERKRRRNSRGMWVIPNTSMGFTVEEDDNVMEISGRGNSNMNLFIDVPINTALQLSCVNGGDIDVEKINGEIEANNTNGGISITDVSGVVLANTTNGDVIVSFNDVTPRKSMSFITLNGKVDVTFPDGIKADLKLKSHNGSIYSDFEIDLHRTMRKVEESSSDRGRGYRVRLEGAMYGQLNGGGPEIHFSTQNGNIYIRKRQ